MITRLTKIQLTVFAIITVLGAAYVGGKYAQLDRLVVSRTFPVTVNLNDSGGLFAGSDVTYRGVSIGRVGEMKSTKNGVQAILDIEKEFDDIPEDVFASVNNKSAVGEQFIDLKPERKGEPYLKAGSEVPVDKTNVPVDAATFIIHLNDLIKDINPESLQTVVSEAGKAFENTGEPLGEILDNTSAFIKAASSNIGVTRQLINDSSTVLNTQVASGSDIRSFARDLALVTDTLVAADGDVRKLLGTADDMAAIHTILSENYDDLTSEFANLKGITSDLRDNKTGLEAVLLLYPYLVQGGWTVLTPHDDGNGGIEYNADFGIVGGGGGLSSTTPPVCYEGDYRERRDPADVSDEADVTDPAPNCTDMSESMIPRRPEFTQYLPRVAPTLTGGDALEWLLTVESNTR